MYRMYTHIASPFGKLLLLSDGTVLTGLYVFGQKYEPTIDPSWHHNPTLKIFTLVHQQIAEYSTGKRYYFDIAYRFDSGTPFQHNVWNAITQIPYDTTVSYKELSQRLAMTTSIRTVAAAIGRNPLLLIVPCHRIIGNNGSLIGYAAGLQLKKDLLELERNQHIINPTLRTSTQSL